MVSRLKKSSRKKKLAMLLVVALLAAAAFVAYALANRVAVADVQSIAGGRVLVPGADMDIERATWSIDPDTSTVTDVDLLVFPRAAVWKLKLFQFFVQVSCLAPDGTESICSTGSTKAILPSHWIGLRPLSIALTKPINPETTEIEDLSFIVTDLNPVPQTPPQLFVGAMDAKIQVPQGGSVREDIVTHGVRGVPAGTQVRSDLSGLPVGVTGSFFDVFATLEPFGPMNVPHARQTVTLTAAADAPLGETDAMVMTSGAGLTDESLVEVEVVPATATPPTATTP